MYATIRRYKTTSAAEVVRLINETFVPRISEIKGFEAYYAFDAGEEVVASTSVFDSQEGADQSNLLAEDWIAKNGASFFVGKFPTLQGEVKAHRVAHAQGV